MSREEAAMPRSKSAHDRHDELRGRVADEGVKLRQAQAEFEAARARVEDRSRALSDAYAAEDAELARERREELQRAEADVVDQQHRVTGAEVRAERARAELASFGAENAMALLEEREGLGRELAAELTAAVAAVIQAHRKYVSERQHVDGLVAMVNGAQPRYDGVSTGYAWERELKELERAWRAFPEAEPPRPRWSGRNQQRNLDAVHRKLREGRGAVEVIGG
jgi:hypothetical protein